MRHGGHLENAYISNEKNENVPFKEAGIGLMLDAHPCCQEYGVHLDEDDVQDIQDLADKDGEIHKVDFILHIKNSRLLKHFETVDPFSRIHWKKKADLAFRWVTSSSELLSLCFEHNVEEKD